MSVGKTGQWQLLKAISEVREGAEAVCSFSNIYMQLIQSSIFICSSYGTEHWKSTKRIEPSTTIDPEPQNLSISVLARLMLVQKASTLSSVIYIKGRAVTGAQLSSLKKDM